MKRIKPDITGGNGVMEYGSAALHAEGMSAISRWLSEERAAPPVCMAPKPCTPEGCKPSDNVIESADRNFTSRRTDQRNARKVGPIPRSIASEQAMTCDHGVCPDEEVRQRRGLAASFFAVGQVSLSGEHAGFKGQFLPHEKRGLEPLINRHPVKPESWSNLSTDHCIDDQRAASLRLRNLSGRPAKPNRISREDVQQDIGINECCHRAQSSPRVSAILSSVVSLPLARPILDFNQPSNSSQESAAHGTALRNGTVSSNSSTLPTSRRSFRRIGSGMKLRASLVRATCMNHDNFTNRSRQETILGWSFGGHGSASLLASLREAFRFHRLTGGVSSLNHRLMAWMPSASGRPMPRIRNPILLSPLMRSASLRAAFGCLLAFLILVRPTISASLRLSRFTRLFCRFFFVLLTIQLHAADELTHVTQQLDEESPRRSCLTADIPMPRSLTRAVPLGESIRHASFLPTHGPCRSLSGHTHHEPLDVHVLRPSGESLADADVQARWLWLHPHQAWTPARGRRMLESMPCQSNKRVARHPLQFFERRLVAIPPTLRLAHKRDRRDLGEAQVDQCRPKLSADLSCKRSWLTGLQRNTTFELCAQIVIIPVHAIDAPLTTGEQELRTGDTGELGGLTTGKATALEGLCCSGHAGFIGKMLRIQPQGCKPACRVFQSHRVHAVM